jgi:phage shock protein PspC (stress-responsive transcriptional regulator)
MTFNQLLKSKTLWAGFATICTGLGLYFSGEQTLQELLVVAMGVVFSILRFYTEKPLGHK